MTVSRLERPAGTNFFSDLRPVLFEHDPARTAGQRSKSQGHISPTRTFGSCFSTGDLGEVRHLVGRRADAGEQRETIGAHRLVLIIHENAFKE